MRGFAAMKAAAWRRRVGIAVAGLIMAGLGHAAAAKTGTAPQPLPATIGLPLGLPELPALGEAMQRDLRSGLALNGFDPVAYRSEGRATPGLARFELTHRGVTWRFVSAANRAAFSDAPDVYEPAFAGFDGLGVLEGRAIETNPTLFAVVGQRLVLFRTPENRRNFIARGAAMAQADARWREVYRMIAR
jgi:hypothetical protein